MRKPKNNRILPFLAAVLVATALVLCVFAANGDGFAIRHNGAAVTNVLFSETEKTNLTLQNVPEGAELQWQIRWTDDETWVDISGQTEDTLTLSQALVTNMLDWAGRTAVRCIASANGQTYTTEAVEVQMSFLAEDVGYWGSLASVEQPAMLANPEGQAVGVTVRVRYVYYVDDDEREVWGDFTANLEQGVPFKRTVSSPAATGYAPSHIQEGAIAGVTLNPDGSITFDIDQVNESLTVTLVYAAQDVKYRVQYYLQNVGDDLYTLQGTKEYMGLADGYPSDGILNMEFPGFSRLYYDPQRIAANGRTVFDCFYDRNYYLIKFDLDGGFGVAPVYARFQDSLVVGQPTRAGYNFVGWDLVTITDKNGNQVPHPTGGSYADGVKEDSLIQAIGMYNSQIALGNYTYKAIWEQAETSYTVAYWIGNGQNDENKIYIGSSKVDGVISGNEVSGQNDLLNRYFCGIEEHVHTAACYICNLEGHAHTQGCFAGSGITFGAVITNSADMAAIVAANGGKRDTEGTYFYFVYAAGYYWCKMYIDGEYWNIYINGSDTIAEVNFGTVAGNKISEGTDGYSAYKYEVKESIIQCGTSEHYHSNACYVCDTEAHTHHVHVLDCYSHSNGGPSGEDMAAINAIKVDDGTDVLESGCVYEIAVGSGRWYKLYFDGQWFECPASLKYGNQIGTDGAIQNCSCCGTTHIARKYRAAVSCGLDCTDCERSEHIHGGNCYTCGKVSHAHSTECLEEIAPYVVFRDADEDVVVNGDGSTVVNVYYEYKMYTIRYVYARCNMNGTNPTYQIADWTGQGSLENCSWQNIGSSVDVLPDFTDPSGAKERSSFTHTDGNIYYYISLTVKYGANIAASWPSANIGDVQYGGWTYKFGSWAAAPGTEYRELSELNANVIGPYPLMSSEMIVENPELLEDGSYLAQNMVAWWNAGGVIGTHTYHNYFEAFALPDGATEAGTIKIYGTDYPKYEYTDSSKTVVYVKYGEKYYEQKNEVFVAAHNNDTRVDPVNFAGFHVINNDPIKQTASNNYYNINNGSKTCSECGSTCNYCNTFFYDRTKHVITFWNLNGTLEDGRGSELRYGASLKVIGDYLTDQYMSNHYPSELEPGAYVLDGWYTTPGCLPGTEVDWDTMTMPDADYILYANWVPRNWTVNFYYLETDVGKEEPISQKTEPHNEVIHSDDRPVNPTREGYIFIGWFYYNNRGEKVPFDISSMPVQHNLDLFAEWFSTSSVTYTVHYELEDGTQIAEPTTGYLFAGATKTFLAKTGTQLEAAYQSGYYPNTSSVSILMEADSALNVATITYKKVDSVRYTVRRVDAATGTVLKREVIGPVTATVVTEFAEPLTVDGKTYLPQNFSEQLVLSADESKNVITFYYVKANTTGSYVIRYYLENLNGTYDEQPDYYYNTAENDTSIDAYADAYKKAFTGFTLVESTNPVYGSQGAKNQGTVTTGGLLELSLYYTRNSYSYTVRYEVKDTGALLKEETGMTGKYGDTVSKTLTPGEMTLTSDDIQYSLVDTETTKNVTIGINEAENVITFYYEPTKAVLEITNSGLPAGCTDTFLYKVVGPMELADSDNCIELIVAVKGNGTATIGELVDGKVRVGLYAGTYQVTPLTDWSYRYDLQTVAGGETVTDKPYYEIELRNATGNEMFFTYSQIGSDWLGGEAYRKNDMEFD